MKRQAMREFWRHYWHDLKILWRMFVIILVVLFLGLLVMGRGDPNATLLNVALTAVFLGLPLFLIVALPLPFFRPLFAGAFAAVPVIALVNWVVPMLGLGDTATRFAHPAILFGLIIAGMVVRVPVTLRGRRIMRPANALVFGSDDPRTEIFARIRPTAGQAFPDPLFRPHTRRDGPGEVYTAPVRQDAGRAMEAQIVTVVEERAPEYLHLHVDMRARGKPVSIEQKWYLATQPDGAVQVTVRQQMRLGPLNWFMLLAADTVGDWLEAVLTWITGEDMRAAYGRTVNRRIAKAQARRGDRQADGQTVSEDG